MDEIASLRTLAEALDDHDEKTQARLLRWAWDRYVEQPKRDRLRAKEEEAQREADAEKTA